MAEMRALAVLALAMEREKGGREFYLKAAAETRDPKGKEMFQWLADEELRHFQKLYGQRRGLAEGGKWQKPGEAVKPIDKSEFPDIAEARGEVKVTAKERDALQMGINAEKESIELYRKAAEETADPDGREMFLRLVEEEKGHLELLEAEDKWLVMSKAYFTLHRFSLPPR